MNGPSTRLRAAEAVYNNAKQGIEIEDIDARLDAEDPRKQVRLARAELVRHTKKHGC